MIRSESLHEGRERVADDLFNDFNDSRLNNLRSRFGTTDCMSTRLSLCLFVVHDKRQFYDKLV